MSTYNEDGQINTTVVDGSTFTGVQASDGSWNIVLNDGSAFTGLYHKCGAYNAVVVTDPFAGPRAANGSMNVIAKSTGGYTPSLQITPAPSGFGEPIYGQGVVKQNGSTSSTTIVSVLPNTVESGSKVLVTAFWNAPVNTDTATCTDDKGNTYQLAGSAYNAGSSWRAMCFYSGNVTNAPKTVTVTINNARQFGAAIVDTMTGLGNFQGFAGQAQSTVGTATDALTSGNISVAANTLVYGTGISIGSFGLGYGTSASGRQTVGATYFSESKIVSSAGNAAATFTAQNAADTNITLAMAFNNAGTALPRSIPMSFNDPMFTNMVELTGAVALVPGQAMSKTSIQEQSGLSSIGCQGNNKIFLSRVDSRECVRVTVGDCLIEKGYFRAISQPTDHTDGIQVFASGATGGTVTVKDTHITVSNTVDTTACFTASDGWSGTLIFDNVLFNGGPMGLKVGVENGCHIDIYMKDCYFANFSGSDGFIFQDVGTGTHTIHQWDNVRAATIVGNTIVPGALLTQPA